MQRLLGAIAATFLTLAGGAFAKDAVVVELFTSQGCSSCPPADRLLAEIAERDDVIALALHVDYWDYIGWKDQFADPGFTQRQRDYARAAGERSIYTPQMVIGGVDHIVGVKAMKLADLLAKHAATPDPVKVTLSRDGDRVTVRAKATGRIRTDALVQLVTYTPEATVDIRRGENAGRRLSYHNIAQAWVTVGKWDGRGEFRATARVSADTPVVVLVQDRKGGPILGASRLKP